MSIAVIYGSTRKPSNSAWLANEMLKGMDVTSYDLMDYTIHPIVDQRHDEDGFDHVEDDFSSLMKELLQHDAWVFVTPVYWYSMSGIMKNFIDRTSQAMRDSEFPDFRKKVGEKIAYVVTVGGDNPRIKALPMIQQFQYIFDFYGATFGGYLIGQASKPGDIERDERAREDAKHVRQLIARHK